MKFIKLKNILIGIHFENPIQKIGKHWQFNFSCNLTKTNITVGKGRAQIISYIIALPGVSVLIQKTKRRIVLVENS